jgi:hypothetical protein
MKHASLPDGRVSSPRDALAAIRDPSEEDPYRHLLTALTERVHPRDAVVAAWGDRYDRRPLTAEEANREAHGIAELGPAAQRLVAPALERHQAYPSNWTCLMVAAAGSPAEIAEHLPRLLQGDWMHALDDHTPFQRHGADLVGGSTGRRLGRRLFSDLASERVDILMRLQDAVPATTPAAQQSVAEFAMGSLLMEAGSHGELAWRWVDALARTDCPPAVLGQEQGYLPNSPGRFLDWVELELVRGHTELGGNDLVMKAVTTMALSQRTLSGNGLAVQDQHQACAVLGRLAALT